MIKLHWLDTLGVVTGVAAAYYIYLQIRATANKSSHESCFMAPNLGGQMHLYMEDSCDHKNCPVKNSRWVIDTIDNAKESVDVMFYLLSYPAFTDAFIRAKKRGLRLRVIMQFDKSDEGTQWVRLQRERIPLRMMDVPPSQLQHVKMVIIDQKSVLFGSMNFTVTGLTDNFEELVLVSDPYTVRSCRDYFLKTWKLMTEHDQFLVECQRDRARFTKPTTSIPHFRGERW